MIAETLAFGSGTAMGAGFKMVNKLIDGHVRNTTEKADLKKAELEAQQTGWAAAREFAQSFSGGTWARRFIVITVYSYLFLFPFYAVLKGIPVNYVFLEKGAGLFAWLFGLGEGTQSQSFDGFTILPFQTSIASFIAGFYFGASTVN